MTYGIQDAKKALKLVEDVVGRIEKLDNLFARLGPAIFINLSIEEKRTIDASLEGNDLLSAVILILDDLKNIMQEAGGEDSEDDGDDEDL